MENSQSPFSISVVYVDSFYPHAKHHWWLLFENGMVFLGCMKRQMYMFQMQLSQSFSRFDYQLDGVYEVR